MHETYNLYMTRFNFSVIRSMLQHHRQLNWRSYFCFYIYNLNFLFKFFTFFVHEILQFVHYKFEIVHEKYNLCMCRLNLCMRSLNLCTKSTICVRVRLKNVSTCQPKKVQLCQVIHLRLPKTKI